MSTNAEMKCWMLMRISFFNSVIYELLVMITVLVSQNADADNKSSEKCKINRKLFLLWSYSRLVSHFIPIKTISKLFLVSCSHHKLHKQNLCSVTAVQTNTNRPKKWWRAEFSLICYRHTPQIFSAYKMKLSKNWRYYPNFMDFAIDHHPSCYISAKGIYLKVAGK